MKKIAVIGTSNSIIKDGYGQFLLELLPGQVDIYGLGGCSSLHAVFSLLKYELCDKYEYIVFDFCINDYSFTRKKKINTYLILAYWSFVFDMLRKSNTTPIFLLLSVRSGNRQIVDFYIKMARLFNVEYIDVPNYFRNIRREQLYRDHVHYTGDIQRKISLLILERMNQHKSEMRSISLDGDIRFYVLNHKLSERKEIRKTSLVEMECYAIDTRQENIVFPQDAGYISGILFWSDGPEGGVYDLLDIHDATNRVQEDLNLEYRGFFVRELAASLPEGLKAPVISFQQAATSHVDSIPLKRNPLFYVNSFLFCTVPPVAWGKAFYQRHKAVLKESFRQRVQYGVFLLRMLAQKAASAVTRMRQACGKLSSRKNA